MSTALLEKLTALDKRLDGMENQIKSKAAERKTGAVPAGAPFARRGENIMGSRGFSFAKLMLATAYPNEDWARDHAKIELGFSHYITKNLVKQGWTPASQTGRVAPFWPEAFNENMIDEKDFNEMKSLIAAGIEGNDPEEMTWLAKRYLGYNEKATVSSPVTPAASWIDQSVMGSFVPPPTFGPPIELLRNREVMMSAGATVYPLGPSGRLIMPRLTAATQGGWAGENTQQAPVNPGTGQLLLSAKKVIALVVMPNELLRFASPAAEQMIRNDLFKTVALIADKGFLDGQGSDNVPLGLATMGAQGSAGAPSAGSYAASAFGCNIIGPTTANQLAPQDVYTFLAAIEENNGEASAWIMRPLMFYAFTKARWTPYSGGTSQGAFTFDLTRTLDHNFGKAIAGLKVVTSPQVSNTRGTNQTYVIALDAADYILGMFGAIEFTQTDAGFTLLSSDQTAVRAILTCDGGQRHPGLVSFCDVLNFVVAG